MSLTSDNLHLRNAMAIPQDGADLRRRCTLPGEFADLVDHLFWSGFEPCRWGARVWYSGGADALSIAV